MGTKDPRVDAYIAKSADFAKPILNHLRSLVHKAVPDVEETMKWSFPHFDCKGMLCSMASFKQHCAFGFWKERLLLGTDPGSKGAMGSFGRITSLKDLPSDSRLIKLIQKAAELNDAGVKVARTRPAEKKPLRIPSYFKAALQKNKTALATFNNFSYSNKKDYVEWVTETKSEETRSRRLATAIEWLAEGKPRNWKYMK
ncbi:MAG TPA: YdeI/OmpD-associated family protein [Bacteroidota bacterium]|nr:YdeI/OmpD-associated family protein [Bacteroidota bacterium]